METPQHSSLLHASDCQKSCAPGGKLVYTPDRRQEIRWYQAEGTENNGESDNFVLGMQARHFIGEFIFFFMWTNVLCIELLRQLKPNCTHRSDSKYHGTLVNCSAKALTSVPDHLPQNTTTLILSQNRIKYVPAKTFVKLAKLKDLDLSNNGHMTFEDDAFLGLDQLEVLMLNHRDWDSRTVSTFRATGSDYPDQSLSRLLSLKILYVNGLHDDFGPGFANLTNLRNLSLSFGDCNIGKLRNSTFSNVPFLMHLNLSNCEIVDTESLAFSPLKNISTVDLSLNRNLGFEKLSKVLYGLKHSPIRILNINRIYPEFRSCSEVHTNDIIHLQATNLTHLYLDGNGITGCEIGAIVSLPRTLEHLSARENRFEYGVYMFEFIAMQSLEFVDFSLMNVWHKIPSEKLSPNPIPIPLPPKLTTIVAEKCYIKGAIKKSTLAKNNLKKVIASHNLLSTISGPVDGIQQLEYIDLSHNQLVTLQSDFFPANNSIRYIDLAHNYLGKEIETDNNGSIFNHLCHATYVDISNNMINSLPKTIFTGLKAVEILKTNDNFLESFEASLKKLTYLKLINLSNNKLKSLSKNTLAELQHLTYAKVNLEGNPLQCVCQEIYFLKWMKHNPHYLTDLSKMTCELTNGTIIHLNYLQDVLASLERECQPQKIAAELTNFIIIASCCLFIIVIICISLAYRHRWKIRYFYYIARRRYWGSSNRRNCDTQYVYDVFVSYAETDRDLIIQEMISEIEVKAGLKMCIHHRDFLPGDVIASSIVNAIDKSKKTLIVLSPAFLESEWCMYEFQIALQTRVSRRQNSLLVLLYRHVPVKDLPRDMAVLLSANSYLEYNPDVYGKEAFWTNLSEAVRIVQPLE